MTVEEMIQSGDIVEFRKHLAGAKNREVLSLWYRNYRYQKAFRQAVDEEVDKRKLITELKL